MSARLLTGDCRALMMAEGPFDLIVADQPYGDTSLSWDSIVPGWLVVALLRLKPTGSVWVFGSMRCLMSMGTPAGFRYAQDIVWEKPNGSRPSADRFNRVHEHAVQFIRADSTWRSVYNDVQRVPQSGPDKSVKAQADRAAHTGSFGASVYKDDGLRIVRSVVRAQNVRGGPHKTAKPVDLLELLIRTSCPPGGLVGDFFAGSGAAGEAAQRAGRRYVGCELDPAMAEKARSRLSVGLQAA